MRYKLGRCLIDERLREAGLERAVLEVKTGYSRQQLSDYATNRKRMSLETAISISETVGCDTRELYELIPVRVGK